MVGSESLGLMIRGGVEYGLGIFITGVDEESAAHKAGLQVSYLLGPTCSCCWI